MVHDRDEWLMAQVARGRHEELEILVRRYASPLLMFIRGMLGDHQRSEDLFQDVFVAVWRHRRRYRPERPFVIRTCSHGTATRCSRRLVVRRPLGIAPRRRFWPSELWAWAVNALPPGRR